MYTHTHSRTDGRREERGDARIPYLIPRVHVGPVLLKVLGHANMTFEGSQMERRTAFLPYTHRNHRVNMTTEPARRNAGGK